MNNKYQVTVEELKEIHELPNAWTQLQFKGLLEHIEYEGISEIADEELKEMTCLALSDFTPEEAEVKVLEFRLGDKLNKGQRLNIAEELRSERIWEEYAEIKLHEELFNVSCMLFWAFPRKFHEPDIIRVKLSVRSINSASEINLKKPTAAFIARLLNDGMDEHNTIYRLFEDSLTSNAFPEAEDIIWSFEDLGYQETDHSNTFIIYTSWNWIDEIKGVKNYESKAFSDGQL